jgi:hypothetical protein
LFRFGPWNYGSRKNNPQFTEIAISNTCENHLKPFVIIPCLDIVVQSLCLTEDLVAGRAAVGHCQEAQRELLRIPVGPLRHPLRRREAAEAKAPRYIFDFNMYT